MSAAEVWTKVAQRQLTGMATHAELADALDLMGESRLARQQRERFADEAATYASARHDYVTRTGEAFPRAQVQQPQLGDLPDARSCVAAWLDWETATAQEYQRLNADARKSDPNGAPAIFALAFGASREADAARSILARLDSRRH